MSWGESNGVCELAVGQKTRPIESEGQATPAFQSPTSPRASVPVRSALPCRKRGKSRRFRDESAGHPAGRSTSEDIAIGRATNNAIALAGQVRSRQAD